MQEILQQMPPALYSVVCGTAGVLLVLWSLILYRRMQRNKKAGMEDTEQAPKKAKTVGERDKQKGLGQSVRDFFFYTEEEKAAMAAQKSTARTASRPDKPTPDQPPITEAAPPGPLDAPAPPVQITQGQATQKPASSSPAVEAELAPPDAARVMRIWRDVVDGRLLIQIGKVFYHTLGDIKQDAEDRRFMAVLRELARIAKETGQDVSDQAITPIEKQATPTLPPVEAAPVLQIWRDVIDGSLIVQINDAFYRTLGDIKTAGEDRRFMAVLRELARIAKETGDQITPKPMSEAPSAPQPQPANPVTYERPTLTGTDPEDDAEPLGTFFDNVRMAIRTGGKSAQFDGAAAPLSIPEQIDAVLQRRLQQSGTFPGRSIRVFSSVSGGVLIDVDGTHYEAVSDIADDDVRTFVQRAIQEWEQTS